MCFLKSMFTENHSFIPIYSYTVMDYIAADPLKDLPFFLNSVLAFTESANELPICRH
jgi:hypothetical protein